MASVKRFSLSKSARPKHENAQLTGDVEQTKEIGFIVFVRPKTDAPALPDLKYWQNTPLNERKFLTIEEYAKTYGSSTADVEVVTTSLRTHGITVQDQHLGAGTVTALATAAQIKSLFEVQLKYYKAPTPASRLPERRSSNKCCFIPETEIYHGYEGQLSLPVELSGVVTYVVGLDSRSIAAPSGFSGDPINSNRLLVTDIAGLYNFPTGIDSSDQTIGVFNGGGADASGNSTSNYDPADIITYFNNQVAGFQTQPTVVPIPLKIGTNAPYMNITTNPTEEITQDIETAATIAQGCTVNVYFSDISEQGWIVFLNRILFPQGNEKTPNVVSCSWIMFDENTYGTAFSFLFQRLAAVGISFFAAAGDWGSNDNVAGAARVGYPASDPYVTCVGGTVVGNIQNGPPRTFDEYAWSDITNASSQFSFGGGGTTGGGMSGLFSTPDYQTAASITSFKDSTGATKSGGRFIPDIAGMVGYNGIELSGSTTNFIGTSCSCPLYAGFFASLRSALGTSFGLLNSTLYQLGSSNATNGVYNDVKIGNNDPVATPDDPYYNAAVGFDPVTGWGSIHGTNMLNALAKALFPPSMYVTVIKNSFGLSEVQGNVVNGVSEWNPTLLLTLEGFSPNDVTSLPSVSNTIGSDTTVKVGPAQYELKTYPSAVQRILFPISISFGPISRHATNGSPAGVFPAVGGNQIESTLKFDLTVASGQTLEAFVPVYLLPGADPYFSNLAPNVKGAEWYLSQDLRVFTVCPGINASPIVDASRAGLPTLSPASNTTWEAGPGYAYIQSLLNYFNSPGTADPFTILPAQSNAFTEDSLVAPTQANPAGGTKFANYSFAIARVRSSSSTAGKAVKVFFRLFTSNHPQTWFLPATSFAQSPSPPALPQKPLPGTDGTTIPFFASGNLQTNTDYNSGGANTRPITSAGSSYTYYGCFLDVYSGNYTLPAGIIQLPVSAFLAGGHQCLVAQIAFDDAPIQSLNGVLPSPQNSDKLAQRNLEVDLSDNPGPEDTHLVPQTFDVAPTKPPPPNAGQFVDLPDELIIDWGNTPIGSTAQIYWPSVAVSEVITTSKKLYPTHQLRAVSDDPNTIEVTVPEGFTIIPIPFGTGPNIAGLVTVQLPLGIVQGQEFLITVRRIATRVYQVEQNPSIVKSKVVNSTTSAISRGRKDPIQAINYRYTAGYFAIKIPVVVGRQMLPIELDKQSIVAWRLNQISVSDRWYKVLQRYLSYINGRVTGLGGLGPIVPSPTGIDTPTKPFPGHGEPEPPFHHHHHHHHHRDDCGCCGCCCASHEKSKHKDCKCGDNHQSHDTPCPKHPKHSQTDCPECHAKEPSPPEEESYCGKITHIIHDRFGLFGGFKLKLHGGGEISFRNVEQKISDLVNKAWGDSQSVEVTCLPNNGEKEVKEICLHKRGYE